MRTQTRNKQPVWYALYDGEYEILTEEGKRTGEYMQEYTTPVRAMMNISAARGTADIELFGIEVPYTKTIVTDDMTCPIAEDSVLWIGSDPTSGDKYNYVVVRVAKSLNSIAYAVKEVDVNE